MRCSRKDAVYSCAGLRVSCKGLISDRLKRTDKAMKRRYGAGTDLRSEAFLNRLTSARELLADSRRRV